MESKRTKLWRRKQGFRFFKAQMIVFASYEHPRYQPEGCPPLAPLHWFELAKEKWTRRYRSTRKPCSCPLCKGIRYNRLDYKRETRRILRESEE